VPRPRASFRIKVEGIGRLDEVPLREVADLLRDLVSLVARSSGEVIAKPIVQGRHPGPVEQASRIRLVSLHSGSVVAELLPAPPAFLPDALID